MVRHLRRVMFFSSPHCFPPFEYARTFLDVPVETPRKNVSLSQIPVEKKEIDQCQKRDDKAQVIVWDNHSIVRNAFVRDPVNE